MSGRDFPEPAGNYQSFIVRVYVDNRQELRHGQITHVSSRSRRHFETLEETPGYMRGLLTGSHREGATSSESGIAAEGAGAAVQTPAAETFSLPQFATGIPLEALPPWDSPKTLQRAFKRGLDTVISLVALALLAIPMLVIAILIKLDSPGPVIYSQRRAGERGRIFTMYKFRSMRNDADDLLPALSAQNEQTLPLFKIRNDPRKTRIGRILRRLSLDELPQLFNVLKGDLSLVGPRPPMAGEVLAYETHHWQRMAVPQGITGLWQVSGRSLLSFDEMLMLDIEYIRNWSLMSDIVILLRTLPTILTGRGAF